ncbi:MAG: phage tail tip lysozyme [Lachnospiraceae bacterium]|nr:phage tail tip lysozyme [Lachnospiraceae bacterium]
MADDFNMDSSGGGNLFKDITRGLFHEIMPVAATTVDSGREALGEFKSMSRKLTSTIRQDSRKVSKTYQGRQATAAFDAAMHDIASGTFDVSRVNDHMYDDYDDIEKETSVESLTAEDKAAMAPEEIIAKSQQGISRAVIRSASAQMDAMMGVAQSIMGSNIAATKALGTQLTNSILYNTNTINANLMVTNSKLTQINSNLEQLIQYQNVNTTKFYEKNLEVMTAMGKMIANLEAMDTGKQRKRTNMRARHGFDFREYASRIKRGLKSSIFATGASMVKTTASMQTPGENIASILSMFLPEKLTKPLKNFDSHLGQNFEEILKRIGDKASGNMLLQLLGIADALGNKRSSVGRSISMGAYQKDMLPWNGKAQRALVEVIPELLTSIDAGINKTDKRYYDYDQGQFKSRKEIEKAFDDEYFSRISFEMDGAIAKISKAIESASLSAAEKATAKNRMSDIVHDRAFGNGDVIASRQQMADMLSQMNVSTTDFTSILRDFEKSLESVTESMEDLYDKVGSSDSIYRVVNNRSGSGRRQGIGQTAAERLADNAKSQSIFSRSYIDQNINDSVDAIVAALEHEFPEEDVTGAIKRQIYSDLLNGADEQDVLKRYRNEFGRGKGWGKLLDAVTRGRYSANRQARQNRQVNPTIGRFGDRVQQVDDQATLWAMGVRYNGQGPSPQLGPTPSPPPGPAGSRANPQGGPQPPAPGPRRSVLPIPERNGGPRQSTTRSQSALGDTTLVNKKASSQRSQMNGDVAGAEAAHRGGNDEQLSRSVNDPSMDRAMDSLAGSMSGPFDSTVNANEATLDLNERNRAALVGAISELPPQSGGVMQAIKNMIDVSRVGMTTMLSSFTDFGARLFGKNGMIKSFFESDIVKKQMEKVKDKLFNEKDGIFKDQIAWLKSTGAEIWGNTKEELAKGYNWVYDQYYINKYGTEDYRSTEEWQKNAHAQKMDFGTRYLEKRKSSQHTVGEIEDGVADVTEATEEVAEAVKSSVNQIEESLAPLADGEAAEVLKSSINRVEDAAEEGAQKIKTSLNAVADTIADEDERKSSTNRVKDVTSSLGKAVKKGAPKVLAGGIAGLGLGALHAASGGSLLTSMFLPGGPIGGAIVGSGIALLSQTEAFKSFMFGKQNEKTGEREGGLISKKMKEGFKKAAPIAIGGAALGALKAIIKMPFTGGGGLGVLGMQLLPGGILGGALLGMGVGLLKNSDLMQNTLFGKKKDGSPNALAKGYGKVKDLFKGTGKAVTNGIKGAGIGALTGVVLSNMGFLPAMLSLGGPVGMGVAGLGIGIASSTKHFNEWMFGTEELDENGEPTGKRKGGMLQKVRNLLTVNVIDPITDSFRENMLKFLDWGKDKITLPFRTALGPILDSITGIKDNVVDYMKDKFDMIGEGIKAAFTGTIKTLFSPVTKLIGTIGKGAMNVMRIGTQAALAPVQMGLGALNLATMGKRRKEYMAFYKQYYAKGNINKNLNEYWDAQEADGNKVGFLGRMADRMSAYMGRGPIADAAREGYNEEMAAAGKNHLNWRGVAGERRDLKEDRKRRNATFKQWKRIDKLRKSIANNDLEGEEAELTPAMFDRYRKKFIDLGIDESMLQSNDDLMQLIYHKSDFRKRAAGDSGKLGESMALSQFRSALQEEMRVDEQLKAATETNTILDDIRDQFRDLADRVLFDRQSAGYMDERKEDKKRLNRRFKNLYKTGLWDKRTQGKIDLDDPELLEYDISRIDSKMLREFAMSNFAQNGDFKGFLEAYGRKMSPDDKRRDWISGIRPEDRDTRTHSSDKNAEETSGNPITQAINQLTDEVRRQTNINAAQLEADTGGEIDADDVAEKKGKSFGSRIMNKFSTSGFFGSIFKKKERADKAKARSDKEAAESADAQALGDEEITDENGNIIVEGGSGSSEEEKPQNPIMKFFSTVKGVLGAGVSAVSNSKVGKFIGAGVKFAGALGLVAGVGLTIAELVNPGIGDKIGSKITAWNQNIEENLEGEGLTGMINAAKEKVISFFTETSTKALDWVTNDFLGKDGYLATGIGKVAEILPEFLTKWVIPGIEKTAEFIADNAETLVGAASTVITAVGPPLIETMFKVLPDILIAAGKGLWSGLLNIGNGNRRGQTNLNQDDVKEVESHGGAARDNWEDASEDEATRAEAQGYEVRRTSTGYQINRQYTLDGNQYENSKGEIETVQNSGNKTSGIKFGLHAAANALLGFPGAAATMVKGAGKAVLGGTGGLAGGMLGLLKGGPLGAIGGTITGTKLGTKAVDAASNGLGALKTAGSWLVDKGKAGWNAITGLFGNKSAANAAADLATQYGDDAARILGTVTNAAQNNVDDIIRATANNGDTVVEMLGKAAATGADEVAAAQKNTLKTFLDKATAALKQIPELGPIKKIIEAAGKSKAAAITKALHETVEEWCKKLAKVGQKIASDSKIGNKVISFISDKMAALGIQSASAAATFLISEAVFMTISGIGGAIDAPNLFGVAKSECDWKMRLIAGLMEGILGSTVGGIVDIVLMVLQMVTGYDAKKEFASFLYKKISFNSDEAEDRLENAQNQLALETAIYNKMNGTNLTVQAYNEMANKTLLAKGWDAVTGFFTGKKQEDMSKYADIAAQYQSTSGSYTVNENGEVSLNRDLTAGYGVGDIAQDVMDKIKAKMFGKVMGFEGITTGDKVAMGFGPGISPYSQANPAWGNMPIGTFPSGNTATMATAGCGPTALAAAAAKATGLSVTPAMVGRYAVANGYITNGGANADLFTKGAAGMGLSGSTVSRGDLSKSLESGDPVIISGRGSGSGPYTKAGHVLMAEGKDSNGNVVVTDPSDGKRKTYTMGQVQSGMRAGWKYDTATMGYGPRPSDKLAVGLTPGVSANITGSATPKVDAVTGAAPSVTTTTTPSVTSSNPFLNPLYTPSLPGISSEAANIITSAAGGTPAPGVGNGNLLKVYTDGKEYYVPAIAGYKYNGATMSYVNIDTGASIPVMDVINHTATISGFRWDSRSKAYVSRQMVNGKQLTIKPSDFDPISQGLGPRNGAAQIFNTRSLAATNAAAENSTGEQTVVDELSSVEDAPGTIQNFLDDFTKGNGLNKLLALGRVMEAWKNSILNGTDIWEEYKKLSSGSSTSTGATGDGTAPAELGDVSDQAQAIWMYLRQQGYTKEQAAGIMGCWQAESSNKSKRIEGDYLKGFPGYASLSSRSLIDNYVKNVLFPAYDRSKVSINKAGYKDSDGHYYPGIGLAQWTRGRTKNMMNYADSYGKQWYDLGAQLGFFTKEMSSTYAKTNTKVKSATTISDATNKFLVGYEGISGANGRLTKRIGYAKSIYEKYKGLDTTNGAVVTTSGGRTTTRSGVELNSYSVYGPGDTEDTENKMSFADINSNLTNQVINPIYQKLFELTGINLSGSSGTSDSLNSVSGATENGLTGGGTEYATGSIDPSMLDLVKELPNTTATKWLSKVLNGRLTSPYGSRVHPITKKQSMHWGIDIGAAGGTPIYSTVNGTVNTNTFNDGGYGNYLSITAADGTRHYYAHMKSPALPKKGATVVAGEKIGYVGTTGASTGNHLHYEIRKSDNTRISPDTYKYPTTVFNGGSVGYGHGDIGSLLSLHSSASNHSQSLARQVMGYGKPNSKLAPLFKGKGKFLSDIEAAREFERGQKNELKFSADGSRLIGYGSGDTMAGTEDKLGQIINIITQWYNDSRKSPTPASTTNIVDASTRVVNSTTQQAPETKTPAAPVIGKIDALVERHTKYASAY